VNFAALELDHLFRLEGKPAFTVAIDGGFVARLAQAVSGGRASALDEAEVFIFSVHGAASAVLLFEGDGEELALGGSDELVYGLHFLFSTLVCFDYGENVASKGADGKKKD